MAVAGSTRDAFFLRLEPGTDEQGNPIRRLVMLGNHRVVGRMVESDLSKAADRLLAGEAIYLEAYGMNLPKIQERFKNVTESPADPPA